MSGDIARKGFLFQDNYLLLRVLQSAGDTLDSAWKTGANNVLEMLSRNPISFGVEASTSQSLNVSTTTATLDWDVLILGESKFEFAEVKSSIVTKADRINFWRRLRRELTSVACIQPLIPILVIDPNKFENVDKWSMLAKEAIEHAPLPPFSEPEGNVLDEKHLLSEALWWMCCPDDSKARNNPPADPAIALKALTHFELHCHEAESLELKVGQYLETIFPGGLTDTQQTLLQGWLNKRATITLESRRLFSICELLREIGILQAAVSLAHGTLNVWRNLWTELPLVIKDRTRLSLGKSGESIPAERAQPFALAGLTCGNNRSIVILAPGGAGKSTFVAQAARASKTKEDVFHCGADDLSIDELEELIKAIRFSAALMALRRPDARLFLCVDGLDEADVELRKRWAQLLARISSLPNIRTIVSTRDTVWRIDGDLRKELGTWLQIYLDIWPEMLVKSLLDSTSFRDSLPLSIVELLRTPILLDLFWRTFVESGITDISRASNLQTRHSLIADFWHERLLSSPRHSAITDIQSRIAKVVSFAARNVGAFAERNLDVEGIQLLLSEGVLVREGRLQPRLRFRHPFLRDFALAQWCLESSDPAKTAQCWNSIKGGLQRHGALRAIFEALSDPDAGVEYPQLSLSAVVQAIVTSDHSLASQVAQMLGSREPTPALDPACWPESVQSSLPSEFGGDLLNIARLNGNGAWAAPLAKWPENAKWIGKGFAHEVWQYAAYLADAASAMPTEIELRERARLACRKLQTISEVARFDDEFAASDRWLKMQAMQCVIRVLPDDATLSWVEREMLQSSWRTRSFLLPELVNLASVDVSRTANIYKRSIGLIEQGGHPVIDVALWSGSMDHQAIEWSLAGEDGRRSLLKEYPVVFLPVAMDLAEALWTRQHQNPESRENQMVELMRQFDQSWSEEGHQRQQLKRQQRLGDLIDDSPLFSYWQGFATNDPYERCVKAIYKCLEKLANRNSSDLEIGFSILCRSRMASIQLILLDVASQNPKNPASEQFLRESILDSRLYHISGLEYWIEQGFLAIWPLLATAERAKTFRILKDLLEIQETETDAKRLLALLPAADIPNDLICHRPADGDTAYRPTPCPNRSEFGFDSEFSRIKSNDFEVEIGQWPESADTTLLKSFALATKHFSQEKPPLETLRTHVTTAIEKAKLLLSALRACPTLLEEPTRFWVWQGLTQMLGLYRKIRKSDSDNPDCDVVLGCAMLAMTVLRNIPAELPGELPEGEVWTGYRESNWGHALRLADESLTWPPASDNEELQIGFFETIESAFATKQPLIQLVCTTTVRPWHWLRDERRRKIHDELIWIRPSHPSVLSWSLARLQSYSDKDRTNIFRLLLNRSDLDGSQHLARSLGRYVGIRCMCVFVDGTRSTAAGVANEIITSPDSFPFLKGDSNRSEFLRSFIFGMKEQAKLINQHLKLASDYGEWALKIWRLLRALRKKRNESEGVILLTMHWLEKGGQCDRTNFKVWWQSLWPLFTEVASEGGRPDCFTLMFQLRAGQYNDLGAPKELLDLIENFMKRIRDGALAGTLDLDQRVPENEEHYSWRECTEYASEAVDSLNSDGELTTDLLREQAHSILMELAAEPIRSPAAMRGLYRLQSY